MFVTKHESQVCVLERVISVELVTESYQNDSCVTQ